MTASSTARRLGAASMIASLIVGGALLAAPASAASAAERPGMSIQSTQYIRTTTQSSCEAQRRAAIAYHQQHDILVSYSSKCTYFDWNGTWNAQVVYW